MSKKSQKSKFGSLCNQLISMCQKSRNDRATEQKNVKSVDFVPNESLTQLVGSGNTVTKNEQNPHENFYRQHYEDLTPSA